MGSVRPAQRPWHHRTPGRRRWWLPLLLVPGLPIVLAGQVPAQSARRGTLTGQVLGETGGPLAEADVVVDSAWHARTDPQGGFHLRGIPLGLHLLQVRAIGFRPLEMDLRIARADTLVITITLQAAAQLLPELSVTAQQWRLDRVGFYARRATGAGYFLEGDSLRRLDSTSFVWALVRLRAVHFRDLGASDLVPANVACRGGFNLVVNGWATPADDRAFFLRTLHPANIDAIEIYEDGGIPTLSASAIQSAPAIPGGPAPGPPPAEPRTGSPDPGSPGTGSPGMGAPPMSVAMTNVLIRAALGQRLAGDSPSENAGSSTRCTMVVWERE